MGLAPLFKNKHIPYVPVGLFTPRLREECGLLALGCVYKHSIDRKGVQCAAVCGCGGVRAEVRGAEGVVGVGGGGGGSVK